MIYGQNYFIFCIHKHTGYIIIVVKDVMYCIAIPRLSSLANARSQAETCLSDHTVPSSQIQ